MNLGIISVIVDDISDMGTIEIKGIKPQGKLWTP